MCRLRISASSSGGIPGPYEHETEPRITQITTDELLGRDGTPPRSLACLPGFPGSCPGLRRRRATWPVRPLAACPLRVGTRLARRVRLGYGSVSCAAPRPSVESGAPMGPARSWSSVWSRWHLLAYGRLLADRPISRCGGRSLAERRVEPDLGARRVDQLVTLTVEPDVTAAHRVRRNHA
jgi:hypothetical protein